MYSLIWDSPTKYENQFLDPWKCSTVINSDLTLFKLLTEFYHNLVTNSNISSSSRLSCITKGNLHLLMVSSLEDLQKRL